MRRYLFAVLGLLELAACALLAALAWQLPGRAEVEETVGRAEAVSRNTARQVRHLRVQVSQARQRQPALLALSRKLEKQIRVVGENVKGRQLDERGLGTASAALGDVARGLDGLSAALDPRAIGQLGKGLGNTAAYLDDNVVPAAEKAARTLDRAAESLKADSGKLKSVLAQSPAQLKAARAVVDSLEKFEDGLARMKRIARLENLDAMDEGFKGLQSSLDSGAEQVDRVAGYTIPRVTVRGLKVTVEERDFWPEGKEIASGMRKAAKGCGAARAELATVKREMPRVRESLDESVKVVRATRGALKQALDNQDTLEPLLKTLPANLARLIDDLPAVMGELSRVLRETGRLSEAAAALRQAEKGIATASERWPEVQAGLKKSAELLRVTRRHLDQALERRDEYEDAVKQTVELTTLFAAALPVMLEQLDEGLQQQEAALGELGASVDQVSDTLPAAGRSASRLLVTAKWLLAVVALTVGLHAGHLLVGWRPGRADPGPPA